MLLFGLLCSPSRDPGCIPRCCVLLCTFGDVVCRGAVYVPGYCVSGHAIRVVCPVMLPRELYRRFFSSAEPASTALRLKALPDLKL